MKTPLVLLALGLGLWACNEGSFSSSSQKAAVKPKSEKPVTASGPGATTQPTSGNTPVKPGTPGAPGGPSVTTPGGLPTTPAGGPISTPGTPQNPTDSTLGSDPSALGGPSKPEQLVIPSDCGDAGVTQANLLTKELTNYAPGNFAEYEIFLTDCNGKIKPLTSQLMLFDVDASGGSIGKGVGLSYQITDASAAKQLASGALAEVGGTDLFGHSGVKYFHYESDQTVNVDAGAKSFRLRVGIPDECCVVAGSNEPAADQQISTFLRFGSAAPVTKVILFRGAQPPPE